MMGLNSMTDNPAIQICARLEAAIEAGLLCDEIDEAIRILDELEGDPDLEQEEVRKPPAEIYEAPTYQLCRCCGHMTRESDGGWDKFLAYVHELTLESERRWRATWQ